MWFLKEVIFVVNDTVRLPQPTPDAWYKDLDLLGIIGATIAIIGFFYQTIQNRRLRKLLGLTRHLDWDDFLKKMNKAVKYARTEIHLVLTIPFWGDLPPSFGKYVKPDAWGESFFDSILERLKKPEKYKERCRLDRMSTKLYRLVKKGNNVETRPIEQFNFYCLNKKEQEKEILRYALKSPQIKDFFRKYDEKVRDLKVLLKEHSISPTVLREPIKEIGYDQLVFILCITDKFKLIKKATKRQALVGFFNVTAWREYMREKGSVDLKKARKELFWGILTEDREFVDFFERIVALHYNQRALKEKADEYIRESLVKDYGIALIAKSKGSPQIVRLLKGLLEEKWKTLLASKGLHQNNIDLILNDLNLEQELGKVIEVLIKQPIGKP